MEHDFPMTKLGQHQRGSFAIYFIGQKPLGRNGGIDDERVNAARHGTPDLGSALRE
jgi:hypothetical protein